MKKKKIYVLMLSRLFPASHPKVGDFIVNDYCMGRVVRITDDAYLLDTEQGIPFSCQSTRLWDITKDAKEGDVLYCKGGNGIEYFVMNKGINIYGNIDSYFRYNSLNDFGVDIPSVLSTVCDNITPVTKEQRDLLFQKMKEAGYVWDAVNKELKKIEQKSAWSEEDLKNEIANQYESFYEEYLLYEQFSDIAKHFFELGLKSTERRMTDKERIREEIERLHKEYRGKKGDADVRRALRTVLFFIDSMQE